MSDPKEQRFRLHRDDAADFAYGFHKQMERHIAKYVEDLLNDFVADLSRGAASGLNVIEVDGKPELVLDLFTKVTVFHKKYPSGDPLVIRLPLRNFLLRQIGFEGAESAYGVADAFEQMAAAIRNGDYGP